MINPEAGDNETSADIRTALEQGLINNYMARAAEAGAWPTDPVTASSESRSPIQKPRKPRPTGRGYNEGSDSELDPDWQVDKERPSAEQAATNHRGANLGRRAIAANQYDIDVREAHERGIPLMAWQRARQERAERDKRN